MSRTHRSFLALVACLTLSLIAQPAAAQISPFGAAGTATSTNTVVTYSPVNPKVVQVFNDGAAALFISFNAVATSTPGANVIRINACEVYTFYAPSTASTLGVITAAATTTAYRVSAFYQPVTTASPAIVGTPVTAQAGFSANAACVASTAFPAKGTDVASATALPVPTGGVFHVTGTTSVTSILATTLQAGARFTIIFDGILTFTDGNNIKIAGNFVTTADDTITLVYDGTNFYEVARAIN